jgi:hypothetical protein
VLVKTYILPCTHISFKINMSLTQSTCTLPEDQWCPPPPGGAPHSLRTSNIVWMHIIGERAVVSKSPLYSVHFIYSVMNLKILSGHLLTLQANHLQHLALWVYKIDSIKQKNVSISTWSELRFLETIIAQASSVHKDFLYLQILC